MKARRIAECLIAAGCACACLGLPPQGTNAAMKHGTPLNSARAEVARGKYLVTFGACTDCHTPGSFLRQAGYDQISRWIRCRFRNSGIRGFRRTKFDAGYADRTGQLVRTADRNGLDDGKDPPTDASWHRSCRGTLMPI